MQVIQKGELPVDVTPFGVRGQVTPEHFESVNNIVKYRKIPIISPGVIFVQKAFLLGLFSEGFIIGGNFAFQNGLGLKRVYYQKDICV